MCRDIYNWNIIEGDVEQPTNWNTRPTPLPEKLVRGVFGKYVDKCNRMRIKYTRRMKFCINKYQLLNIKYIQY